VAIAKGDAEWASDTELSNGEIPAILYSEDDLGVHSNVSMIVDMQTRSSSATQAAGASLKHGAVLFAPTTDTNIETSLGTISIDAGSLVFVAASHDGVAVYNIFDSHSNSVVVHSADRLLALAPGKQVLLTRKTTAGFDELNPSQCIGYRNIRELGITNGIKAFASEFSILHSISVVQPLKQLVKSSNPRSQKLINQTLKTYAILNSMQGSNAVYRPVPRAVKLACAR
jgi:hypothetical protein